MKLRLGNNKTLSAFMSLTQYKTTFKRNLKRKYKTKGFNKA